MTSEAGRSCSFYPASESSRTTARLLYPPALRRFSLMPSPIRECALSVLARTLLRAAEMMGGGWGDAATFAQSAKWLLCKQEQPLDPQHPPKS